MATELGQTTYPVTSPVPGLNLNALTRFFYDEIPSFVAPLRLEKFGLGQSNPTFLVKDGREQTYVLRKKPTGPLISKGAHAIEREYKVLAALNRARQFPVPRVYFLCPRTDIVGAPFYIMEYISGRIFSDPTLKNVPKADRASYWKAMVETLAQLHRVNLREAGLEKFGASGSYYERQLRTLTKISRSQAAVKDKVTGNVVGELPGLQQMVEWFEARLPPEERTLIHGDYKFDNAIFHSTEPRVVGLLDWELSTLGHPLTDLASLVMCYFVPPALEFPPWFIGTRGREQELGVPTLSTILGWYADSVGRPRLTDFTFPAAFAYFKFAVICQGVRARSYLGQASSKNAMETSRAMEICCKVAQTIITTKSNL